MDGREEWTDWGRETDLPAHWDDKQAKGFLELRLNGCQISEVLYDRYLNSGQDMYAFLQTEKTNSNARALESKAQVLRQKLGDKDKQAEVQEPEIFARKGIVTGPYDRTHHASVEKAVEEERAREFIEVVSKRNPIEK